jgi:hypothetical protein
MSKNGQEKRGNTTSRIAPTNNTHAEPSSMQGSIASRDALSLLSIPGQERQSVPPQKSPAFQKKSMIDSSNSLFDKIKEKPMHDEPRDVNPFVQSESEDESESDQASVDTAVTEPESTPDPKRLTVSVYSRQTSFSFDYPNSDGQHPEDMYFSVQQEPLSPRQSILPKKLYTTGTYQPAGAPDESLNFF